jgi:hypothetical protein
VPVFSDVVGRSPVACSQIDLARAINQAVVAGANIINISGGEFSPTGTAHPILADAIRDCDRSGVLIVAAAGNQGCDCLNIPAALPAVLPVGAMDSGGQPLDFSNWGNEYHNRGVLAPGDQIVGAVPGGGVRAESGTSYATPVMTGVLALLMSLHLCRSGTRLEGKRARDAILRTAIDCEQQSTANCRRLLGGRLNVTGAKSFLFTGVRLMTNGQPDPTRTETEPPTPIVDHTPFAGVTSSPASPVHCSPTQPAERGLMPSGAGGGCGCGGSKQAPQLVNALGQLGFDFGTEARRDGFVQAMDEPSAGLAPNPHDPRQLLAYLERNPWAATSLIWTLSIDATPMYSIRPSGPFAAAVYDRLRQYLVEQQTEGVERVSIPGVIVGSVKLFNGQMVPAIDPELRGMFSWSTSALINAVAGPVPAADADKAGYQDKVVGVRNFLDRVYFELRNLGQTSQERAINYAATNAFNIEKVYEQAMREKMDLDTIEVERSPVCRPESDCWDVRLMFFFPDRQVQTVRKAYRFTIDVSDVVPVTVGAIRSWFVR